MQNIPTKVNGDSVAADEYNQPNNELENAITNSGITLSGSDLEQLSKTITNHVGAVNFYLETGAADAYVLNVTGDFKAPTDYFNGLEIRFRPSNANTGASTINVSSLGIKSIKRSDGSSVLEADDISTSYDTILRYDGTNFRLCSFGTLEANKFIGDVTGDLTGTAFGTFKRIYSNTIAAPTTSINITSLDGDVDIEYLINIYLYNSTGSTANLDITFNNDTGNNYSGQFNNFNNTTLSASKGIAVASLEIVRLASTSTSMASINLYAKSGNERIFFANAAEGINGTAFGSNNFNSGSWSNTASNLTSIQLSASIASTITSGLVEVYARR